MKEGDHFFKREGRVSELYLEKKKKLFRHPLAGILQNRMGTVKPD